MDELLGGFGHTCARSGGTVSCWGLNARGQLGNSSTTDSTMPVAVTGLTNATQLGGGPSHTCARRSDATVVCWGSNQNGQLGDGTTMDRSTPTVSLWTNVIDIGGGGQLDSFTCATLGTGAVECAGDNGSGQLANPMAGGGTPMPMSGVSTAVSTADSGGSDFNCVRLVSGAVECVGGNIHGQLGRGTTGGSFSTLAPAIGVTTAVELVTGLDHACALLADDRVLCWGDNVAGQLGDGSTVDRGTPELVPGFRQVSSVGTFNGTSCATRSDGAALCWGRDTRGALGNGPGSITQRRPVLVSSLDDASLVVNGDTFSCARRSNGTVVCWGYNAQGQLGDGTTTNSDVPVPVMGLSNVRELGAGYGHVCALLGNGTVKCWGEGQGGRLGNGMSADSSVPVDVLGVTDAVQIAVGTARACVRRRDGTVQCWGPTLTPVAGIRDAVHLGVFLNHSCAVRANGTIRCWGSNGEGQLGDGTRTASASPVEVVGLSNAVEVNGGNEFSCAGLASGEVQCWGANMEGQLGDGTNMTRLTPVATGIFDGWRVSAGFTNACAAIESGELMCWGSNDGGQLGNDGSVDSNVPVFVLDLP
ncbi:MAG: RCC1 repeat-containing protein [Myxococcota bacterium]